MMREILGKNQIDANKDFHFRGKEPGRLENFSDAVFALAITLLLISTSPPVNFNQIKLFIFDLIPFSLCIALIILIWHEHFVFYFRYGLRDTNVVFLNTLFLIIVLFYVYPLKFLTRLLLKPIAYLINHEELQKSMEGNIRYEDMSDLMIIYGLGAASVFFVLVLMYRYALKQADKLQLNEVEKFDTRMSIRSNILMGVVPLVSVLVAILFYRHMLAGMFAGFTYFIYTPIMMMHGKSVVRNRKKLLQSLAPLTESEVSVTQEE